MKVLLIAPKFFGYDEHIKKAIEENGHTVYIIHENVDEANIYIKFLCKLFKKHKQKICEHFLKKKLNTLSYKFDHLIVIRGAYLNIQMLQHLKSNNPLKKTVMYQWDSINNNPNGLQICQEFSNVFTFDKNDASNYNWNYLPLFYIKRNEQALHNEYDYAFIGTLHSNRLDVFLQLKQYCKNNNYNLYAYLYTNLLSYIKNLFFCKNSNFLNNLSNIHFKPLTVEKVFEIYSKTKIIVDYTHPKQVGLTMRTIEALANGCKIITNNKNITTENFYNANNIMLYSDKLIELNKDFFNSKYLNDSELINNYNITNWVKYLL